jgi:hypothetical protein
MTTNVEAIRRWFNVNPSHDRTGNLPPMPGIYPDYPAPTHQSLCIERDAQV